jgi:hypothetical protein
MKHFQGDGTIVLEVAGEIDRGHAAAAKLPLEEIAVAKGVFERGFVRGQDWLYEGGPVESGTTRPATLALGPLFTDPIHPRVRASACVHRPPAGTCSSR